ncbi:hypothetical protein GCK72_020666 [Caenorhabditis remanei]|uniref:G-protein coupled receptors family 1 profile domain-containing protein n=1 Tax=Caenorhabditis remanei TaxID=31234 RepID=A0A6A5GFX3_CAERE|nr:hypothetical protein GCK72_020666 [Caenorhabditis remanei]KAF1754108.1 hypothetical protein GCK72_020666 [Caenorhabditis remanei]
MKTNKLSRTSTMDPYDYFTDDFIYSDPFGRGYINNDDYLTENFQQMAEYYASILGVLHQIYDIAVVVNFIVNIPHLFILCQKELRSNLVYIIMIGICLCDFIHSIGKMAKIFMTWHIIYQIEKCPGVYPYYHIFIDVFSNSTQIMSRRCSAFLALFIAAFRSFSVIFPMSSAVNILMKARSAWLIVLMIGLICGGWSAVYSQCTIIEKLLMCPGGYTPSYVMYIHVTTGKAENLFHLIDGCIVITVSLVYIVMALALMIALAAAQKRRKNLKSDKAFFGELEVVALTFSIGSSIAHCFICFCMSSQYRDVVKRFLWKEKKEVKVAAPESSIHPTTVDTTKTSNSSKRTT